ncbi:unnamed protein product [Bemisia tabaci]|uniref:Methionine--tRNA ligase, cytoplasmic n=1 Tax=Bemisia tabaci TaxID=7038 RepID=A0A9P0A803_BEMTA|nr:unnamed protein product [Bemisia tabaci]
MKLITNENNPNALKLFICGNLTCKTIDCEKVDSKDTKLHHSRYPALILDNGKQLFSSNAAALYLFPSFPTDIVDQWLEWEASHLVPSVLKSLSKEGSTTLTNNIKILDTVLSKTKFLHEGFITVADVTVWSTLFGVITEPKLREKYCSSAANVIRWFEAIHLLPEVQAAMKSWNGKSGEAVLTSLQSSSSCLAVTEASSTSTITAKLAKTSISNAPASETTPVKDVVSEDEISACIEAWEKKSATRPKLKPHVHPILPKEGENNVLITSALPYVNNVPHLGNIIGCVLSADVFARYCRLRNRNTLFVSGTDEYGTATETKALEEKLTPQQICDKYFVIHKDIYEWFNIKFDQFGRTTTQKQTEIAQSIFKLVHNNGFTSTASVEQLLCEKCDRFLADRFVEGTCPKCKYEDARGDQCDGCGSLINATELINPRCKVCGNTPVIRHSEQLFLELPKLEADLKKWVDNTSSGWSHNARVIAKSWLKDGLKPRCITRDLKWGVQVPLQGFEKKVFYVWFDAPIGYMSISAAYTDEWEKWWLPSKSTQITLYQFMAKDNVPFHSIMFPAIEMATQKNYTKVSHIMATEYLNYEDGKFSKSRGVGVFGNDARDTGISADVFRFYLLYIRPEAQDSSFSWADMAAKTNTELLNNLGNFTNRALTFCEKFFGSVIPDMKLNKEDFQLLALITRELRQFMAVLDKAKFRDGIKHILCISKYCNQLMQAEKPWVLMKGSEEEKSRAGTVIGLLSNLACLLSIMIRPYMPDTSKIMAEQLNAPESLYVLTEDVTMLLPPGHKIGHPSPIFSLITPKTVEELKARFAGKQNDSAAAKPTKTEAKSTDKSNSAPSQPASVPANSETIEKLEAAVAAQGLVVRKLKSETKDKTVWEPEVKKLLDLKQQLASAKGEQVGNAATKKKK